MTIAERLPELDDKELANLHANALRLRAGDGRRVEQATALIPLIEAEVAERKSRLPAKPAKPAKATARKRAAA